VVRLTAPAHDVTRLTALLAEQLHTLTLPEPVRECELRAAALVAHQPGSLMLWQAREHGGRLGAEGTDLIERLRARLGTDAVHGLTQCDGHRPEKAWARSAPPPPGRAAASGPQSPHHRVAPDARRPLWLLPVPQPLRVRAGLPRRRGPLLLVSEPERIESGWWDGEDVARDYYTAVDIHGVRLWVFRERSAPHRWFLHGVFG
jgi:protein ImuB